MSLKDLEERVRRLENSCYNIVGEVNPSVADAPMGGREGPGVDPGPSFHFVSEAPHRRAGRR